MDTDIILKLVKCTPPSFSVREQPRYRAEVSFVNVNVNVKVVPIEKSYE